MNAKNHDDRIFVWRHDCFRGGEDPGTPCDLPCDDPWNVQAPIRWNPLSESFATWDEAMAYAARLARLPVPDCAMCAGETLVQLAMRTHWTPGGITVRLCNLHSEQVERETNSPLRQSIDRAFNAILEREGVL